MTKTRSKTADAIELLKEDHAKVKKAIKEFEKMDRSDTETCRQLVTTVCEDLKTHTMHVFVAYRIALAVLLLSLLTSGRLAPEEKPAESSGQVVNSHPHTEKGAQPRTQAAASPYNKHLQSEGTLQHRGGMAWQSRSSSRPAS